MEQQQTAVDKDTVTADHFMNDIDDCMDERCHTDHEMDDHHQLQQIVTHPSTVAIKEHTIVESICNTEVFQPPPLPQFQINQRVDCLYKVDAAIATSSLQWYDAIIRKMKLEHTTTTTTSTGSLPQQQPLSSQPTLKWMYLIHYQGWNSRYDQWCTEDTIRSSSRTSNSGTSSTTRNLTGQNTLDSDVQPPQQESLDVESLNTKESTRKRSRSTSPVLPTTKTDSSRRAKRPEHTVVPKICTYSDFCQLPITLQIVLFEEQERITGVGSNKQSILLHHLPGPVPIRKVLQHFIKKKVKEIRKLAVHKQHEKATDPESVAITEHNKIANNNATTIDKGKSISNNVSKKKDYTRFNNGHVLTEEIVRRFGRSLQELFEQALPTCLLYPQEQSQYTNTVLPMLQEQVTEPQHGGGDFVTTATIANDKQDTEKKALIDIYGCEYLLRLFVRLPMILEGTMQFTTTMTKKNSSPTLSTDAVVLSSPYVLGPLLSDLLVVLQKNRTTLFPTKHSYYRATTTAGLPIRPNHGPSTA